MRLFVILSACLIAISCSEVVQENQQKLPYFGTADLTPLWIEESEINKVHAIEPFALFNQDGNIITQDSLLGSPFIANFFFTTCPGICPRLTSHFSFLQQELKDKPVRLVSHSVMPKHDTVPVLKTYAESNGVISGKWHLLTGNKEQLYHLARHSYFADEDFKKTQSEETFIHTENVYLLDKSGRIRGVYNGTILLEMKRLLRHLDVLLKE